MKGSKRLMSTEAKLACLSERARRIYFSIKEKPGIQFAEVGRVTGLTSPNNVHWHLVKLMRAGLIMELREGGYRHLFVVGDHNRMLRPVISRFLRPVRRRIAELLLEGPMSHGEIAEKLGCMPQALNYHLKRMVVSGDVKEYPEGRRAIYSLVNPELVHAALVAQHHLIPAELQTPPAPPSPEPQAAD